MPTELKKRLARHAKNQGVSLNQLANYLLNYEITQLEAIDAIEHRLEKKDTASLKKKVKSILLSIPSRKVPSWDEV